MVIAPLGIRIRYQRLDLEIERILDLERERTAANLEPFALPRY
jgi:hypothetical protein